MDEREEYRYERKFLVEGLDAHQVRAIVRAHPAMFREVYPPRCVNNVYLDTPLMTCYHDNVNGAGNRHKVRVRWYGDLFGPVAKPTLEFKIKRGLVGTKRLYAFAPFPLDETFTARAFRQTVDASPLPEDVKRYLGGYQPVLVNRYHRVYLAAREGRFRLTIDSQMAFYGVGKLRNRFLQRQCERDRIVVELKYAAPCEELADRISSVFPFRVTRSSKYVRGIEATLGCSWSV